MPRSHPTLSALFLMLIAGASACSMGRCNDTSKGEAIFRERCGLCHATGAEAGQGPGLGGVVGRKAAAGHGFAYSHALQSSGLTWDQATLDRFLAEPSRLVPGTTMPIPVPDPQERAEVIAYLAKLRPSAAVVAPVAHSGAAGLGDFRSDAPGVRRHLTVADLPAPFTTPSTRNAPSVVAAPADARLHVPPHFRVERFAAGLEGPRLLRVAPNGDVFVAESNAGRIRVIRPAAPEKVETFAASLDRPFGIAFYPPGPDPRFVYVADNNAVLRFPYRSGDVAARGPAETIVPQLSRTTGGHWTRDVVFSADGSRMFVSVGSGSNVAEGLPARTGEEIHDWEAAHGLGALWGDEEARADVLVFDAEGRGGRAFATGIRNCVGLAFLAARDNVNGDLWCSTNERDGLGDDLVPDYVTRVREGAFYGWPWYYLGDHQDPRHAGERRDLARKITVPDVLLQPHSASLELAFYDGAMFPASFRGNAFAAFHGSWNRATRTGYKVARVLVQDGVPTGEYEDFLTGFVVDEDHVWGRPVGVAVAHDGALLVSEDGNGTIWRVSYTP